MTDGTHLARLQRPGILNGIHTVCEAYCRVQMLDEAMHLKSIEAQIKRDVSATLSSIFHFLKEIALCTYCFMSFF